MANLYCPDCGWSIGQFCSLLDLEGEKGDNLIARCKANHICQPPPDRREDYNGTYSEWMDMHQQGGA